MKWIFLCLSFLLLLPSAHALSLNLSTDYAQSETVVTEIEGVIFTPITPTQITFLRGHVETVVTYDVQRLGSRYFLYFITPRAEQNYTLRIRDVDTMVNGERQLITIESNFSTNNISVPYNVRPGIFNTASDIQLMFTSFTDQTLQITLGSPFNAILNLQPGTNEHTFPIVAFPQGLSTFEVGLYKLLIFNSQEIENSQVSYTVDISPRRIEHVFVRGRETPVNFIVRNIGTTNLDNVIIVYNESRYTFTPTTIKKLNINQSITVNVTLKEFNAGGEDSFIIQTDNESITVPLHFSYNETSAPILNQTGNSSVQGYYCNELGGKICTTGEQCDGSTVSSLSGSCCIGICKVQETSSLAWIGYIIGALILIILVVIGGRYLKTRGAKGTSGLTERVAKLERP